MSMSIVGGGLAAASAVKGLTSSAPNTGPQYHEAVDRAIPGQLSTVQNAPTYTGFGGDRTADFNTNQNAGISMADALATSLNTNAATASTGFGDFAGGNFVGSNPYLEQQIAAAQGGINRNLTRNILPSVRSNAVASGGTGGTRQGIAEGLAMSDANQQAVDAEFGLRGSAYNQDMANMLGALTNQGNILSGQTAGQDVLFNTGALEQQQVQNEINSNIAQYTDENTLQYNRDQALLQTLLGGATAAPVQTPSTNPFAAGIGTYAALEGLRTPQVPTIPPVQPNGIGP